MTDLYAILGLTRRATNAEIKSAYRRLARTCHPDVSASPDASARFVRINKAYQILGDPGRRAAYDNGQYDAETHRTFYASRRAEVVAMQRHFDRIVDEWMERDRKEAADRSHAVLIVVPLFLSAFYVMATKLTLGEESRLIGRILILALACYGLVYLIRNLSIVLSRYTYHIPDHLTSVFGEEKTPDKPISRRAGLIFLVCGYLVSIGLGYVVSKIVPGRYSAALSIGNLLCALIYPPIAVLLVGGIRRIGLILDRL
jgi:DnaJ-domain-containing protein 1